MNDYAMVVHVI